MVGGRHRTKPAEIGPTTLGDGVRRLRKARGLTLEQLGGATGLSHGFLIVTADPGEYAAQVDADVHNHRRAPDQPTT